MNQKNPENCFECQKFKAEKNANQGDCTKKVDGKPLRWIIDMKLAKRQALCDDKETGEPEPVEILSPLNTKSLISRVCYEDGIKNLAEQFWRPLK